MMRNNDRKEKDGDKLRGVPLNRVLFLFLFQLREALANASNNNTKLWNFLFHSIRILFREFPIFCNGIKPDRRAVFFRISFEIRWRKIRVGASIDKQEFCFF